MGAMGTKYDVLSRSRALPSPSMMSSLLWILNYPVNVIRADEE